MPRWYIDFAQGVWERDEPPTKLQGDMEVSTEPVGNNAVSWLHYDGKHGTLNTRGVPCGRITATQLFSGDPYAQGYIELRNCYSQFIDSALPALQHSKIGRYAAYQLLAQGVI